VKFYFGIYLDIFVENKGKPESLHQASGRDLKEDIPVTS
jgi:hypothetical protein